MNNRILSMSLWVSMIALITFKGLTDIWSINLWSVDYLEQRLDSDTENTDLQKPISNHRHAKIWLAEETIMLGNVDKAIALLQSPANERDIFYLRMLGIVYAEQKDYLTAIQIWKQAKDYRSLTKLAKQAELNGDMKTARQAYHNAFLLNKKYDALMFSTFLMNLGEMKSAEAILRQAIQTYPNIPTKRVWLRSLGKILRQEKRWDESVSMYQQVLNDAPDYQTYIDLGWVYYERGDDLEIVIKEFKNAIALNEENGIGFFAIGEVLAKERRFSEADSWFEKAIQREPNGKWYQLIRANTARNAGNLELAIEIYQDIIARFPNWAPVYYEIALIYRLENNQQDAIIAIEKAITITEQSNIWYYRRAGQIYEWVGNNGKAIEAYRGMLLIDPTNTEALDGLQRLESK